MREKHSSYPNSKKIMRKDIEMNTITNDKKTDATRLNHIHFARRKMTMHAMSVEGAGSILPGAKCSSTASKRTRLNETFLLFFSIARDLRGQETQIESH